MVLYQARQYPPNRQGSPKRHLMPRHMASLAAEYKFGDMRTLKAAGIKMSSRQAIEALDLLSSEDTTITDDQRAAASDTHRARLAQDTDSGDIFFEDVSDDEVCNLLTLAYEAVKIEILEYDPTGVIKEILDGTNLGDVRLLQMPRPAAARASTDDDDEEEDKDGYRSDHEEGETEATTRAAGQEGEVDKQKQKQKARGKRQKKQEEGDEGDEDEDEDEDEVEERGEGGEEGEQQEEEGQEDAEAALNAAIAAAEKEKEDAFEEDDLDELSGSEGEKNEMRQQSELRQAATQEDLAEEALEDLREAVEEKEEEEGDGGGGEGEDEGEREGKAGGAGADKEAAPRRPKRGPIPFEVQLCLRELRICFAYLNSLHGDQSRDRLKR